MISAWWVPGCAAGNRPQLYQKRARTARIDPEACVTCGLVRVYRCHDRAHTGGGGVDGILDGIYYYTPPLSSYGDTRKVEGIRSRQAESGGQEEMEDGIAEGCVDLSSRHDKLVEPRHVATVHNRRKGKKGRCLRR